MEWGYQKKSIWVDLEKSSITLGADTVFHLSIIDRKLKGTTSGGYEQHTQDAACQKSLNDAQTKLGSLRTKGVSKKGQGKGPDGITR